MASEKYLLFQDELLRRNACHAVEQFLEKNTPVKRSQLQPIESVIQTGSLPLLEQLVKNQKTKNSRRENKAFWLFLSDILSVGSNLDFAFSRMVVEQLTAENLIGDEKSVSEKVEKKRLRKANRELVKRVMRNSVSIYFEHFNCHYFYLTQRGESS